MNWLSQLLERNRDLTWPDTTLALEDGQAVLRDESGKLLATMAPDHDLLANVARWCMRSGYACRQLTTKVN